MRNGFGRLAATARAAAVALAITTPAWAQNADAAGGTVVLTADVVERLVAGLKAGEVERQAAAKEATPYGRHSQAVATYETAKAKCQQGQQTFTNRMVADEKMMDKYDALVNKMVEAQGRGDSKAAAMYNDSAMAMQDPSCLVKEPEQPNDWYEAQREIDNRPSCRRSRPPAFPEAKWGRCANGSRRCSAAARRRAICRPRRRAPSRPAPAS